MLCRSNQRKLCGDKNCKTCVPRSFYSYRHKEKVDAWCDKNEKKPWEIRLTSSVKFYFNCTDCGHEIFISPYNIQRGGWCRYCSLGGSKNNLCSDEKCTWCFEHSFASHEKSKFWSPKNEKTPREIRLNSHKSFYFNCQDCKHEICTRLDYINNNSWCRYCSRDALCSDEKCRWCFEHSFASHEKSKFWSAKNGKLPREVRLNCNKKFYFNCCECSHEIFVSLNGVSGGKWCRYCSSIGESENTLCSDEKCAWCFEHSFASHEKSKFWSPKNEKTPREIRLNSSRKIYFDCQECKNEIFVRLSSVTSGQWCPCVKNKTEAKLLRFLSGLGTLLSNRYFSFHIENIVLKTQKKFEWCKNGYYHLPYDFYIKLYVSYLLYPSRSSEPIFSTIVRIIIELDGKQHFSDIVHWNSSCEEVQKRDRYKEEKAMEQGINIIRIYQPSVWKDKENWMIKLEESILFMLQNQCTGHKITIGEIYNSN